MADRPGEGDVLANLGLRISHLEEDEVQLLMIGKGQHEDLPQRDFNRSTVISPAQRHLT